MDAAFAQLNPVCVNLRKTYADKGWVFARTERFKDGDILGSPLTRSALDCAFRKLVRTAGVKRITMHALRHCTATWMLGAGEAIHVVSARLWHSRRVASFSADQLESMRRNQTARGKR